jgi:hypothetical protein
MGVKLSAITSVPNDSIDSESKICAQLILVDTFLRSRIHAHEVSMGAYILVATFPIVDYEKSPGTQKKWSGSTGEA